MPIWETSKWRGASRVTRSYSTVVERDGQRLQNEWAGTGGLLAHPRTPSSPPAYTPSADTSYTRTVSVPSRHSRVRANLTLDPAHPEASGVPEREVIHNEEAAGVGPDSPCSPVSTGHQRASPGATTPILMSSHYYGVAHGELGVLSRRQVLQGGRWQTDGDGRRNTPTGAARALGRHAPPPAEAGSAQSAAAAKLPEVHDAPHPPPPHPSQAFPSPESPTTVPPLHTPQPSASDPHSTPPGSGRDTDRSIARLIQQADRGDWLPRSYFAPRGLIKHDSDRQRHVHRSHPTTEVASKPLESCLSGGGQGRGRRRKKGSRARTRVATAPAASTVDARWAGTRLSTAGASLPSSPSGYIRSPGAKLKKGGGEFDANASPPIMKAAAASHNPLSSGGFPGWKTIPQAMAPHAAVSRGNVGVSRGQSPQGPPRMVVSRDGDVIRVFESRQGQATSGDKFFSPWNADPDEIFAGV